VPVVGTLAIFVATGGLVEFVRQRAVRTVVEQYDPRRRFVIGEHVVRPRPAETLRHVRIERLPDA
jgi:hypothetical protein